MGKVSLTAHFIDRIYRRRVLMFTITCRVRPGEKTPGSDHLCPALMCFLFEVTSRLI